MGTLEKFKKALIDMLDSGELEKIYQGQKGLFKKRALKRDVDLIKELKELGTDRVSAIPVIANIQSAEIFRDALYFMSKYDDKEEA